jgi:predicted RNase H-like nuclease (RuvC/YqgF family)
METGTMLGLGALLVSAVGAWNSLHKTRIEDGTATSNALQALNTTYREEIDRLEEKLDESEEECRKEMARCKEQIKREQEFSRGLQETIFEQAQRISNLERRTNTRPRGDKTDG